MPSSQIRGRGMNQDIVDQLPVSWAAYINLAVLLVAVAAAAFGYLRKGPKAAPVADTAIQVIGGTLANRDSVERLAASIDALTAELKEHRKEAADRAEKQELMDELLEKLRREQRTPSPRK